MEKENLIVQGHPREAQSNVVIKYLNKGKEITEDDFEKNPAWRVHYTKPHSVHQFSVMVKGMTKKGMLSKIIVDEYGMTYQLNCERL